MTRSTAMRWMYSSERDSASTSTGCAGRSATIVAESSSDEMLAMRLIRDRLPGQTGRYIKRDLGELLNRHTPLHLLRGSVDRVPGGLPTASEETWRECVGVEPTPD